ncbi:predicted protein [Arabidopsis lyrata subsp. lyrata]|uniref:Predicted protein n=1 Tax=Arabidopsis lyrata subsp. lyrata TaxID=81972 RepID=D7KWT9_ARALL|nr:predicted protein [Arabidopsis lyrata subsp. lyrata]
MLHRSYSQLLILGLGPGKQWTYSLSAMDIYRIRLGSINDVKLFHIHIETDATPLQTTLLVEVTEKSQELVQHTNQWKVYLLHNLQILLNTITNQDMFLLKSNFLCLNATSNQSATLLEYLLTSFSNCFRIVKRKVSYLNYGSDGKVYAPKIDVHKIQMNCIKLVYLGTLSMCRGARIVGIPRWLGIREKPLHTICKVSLITTSAYHLVARQSLIPMYGSSIHFSYWSITKETTSRVPSSRFLSWTLSRSEANRTKPTKDYEFTCTVIGQKVEIAGRACIFD